jgi:hypothetical protein
MIAAHVPKGNLFKSVANCQNDLLSINPGLKPAGETWEERKW